MKILIKTNPKGYVEVVDAETGNALNNIGRLDIYITTSGKVSAMVEFKDVELKLECKS